ncbi:MAG: polysaccharide biosynthesis protein [Lachnospiraceae bacterium]|nr:polysaccharide biosynthesis protein [Lachnospiraceae bacterium]
MSEKRKIAKGIVVQGSILAIAGIICRIIGLARRVPLTNIIGDIGNGYYAGAYEFYSIILILSSYSLPSAVSKLIAQRQSRGQYKKMQKVFQGALLFAVISGGIFSVIVFIFADFFATTVMGEAMSTMALRVLAPTIFVVALMAVFRGYFQGLGVMHFTAVSQILEQIILVIVSLSAASLLFGIGTKYGNLMMNENYAPAFGAAGATIGCGVGALSGLLLMMYFYSHNKRAIDKRVLNDTSKNKDTFLDVLFLITKTAIPMILCSVMYNICGVVDQSVFNHHMISIGEENVKSALWGVYSGKYKLMITLPIALANAMCSAIIPSLTASIENKDYVSARSKMATVIRVTMIISFPSAFGLAILGKPILNLLFNTGEIDLAAIMLLYGSISVVFFSLSTLGNGILQGLNKLKTPVLNSLIAFVLHLLSLVFMLKVLKMGIHSVVVANLLFAVFVSVLNHLAIYRTIAYKQELKQTFIIPLISSCIMGVITFLVYFIISKVGPDMLALAIAMILAIVVYFVSLILLKGVNEYDLSLIPFGTKIYSFLRRLGLYKDEE